MDTPPPPSEPPPVPPRRSLQPIGIGFLVGAAIWLLPPVMNLASTPNDAPFLLILIFAAFILPVISGILAIIRPTRRVGLGLLLACGLGWLILGAMCGGLIR